MPEESKVGGRDEVKEISPGQTTGLREGRGGEGKVSLSPENTREP